MRRLTLLLGLFAFVSLLGFQANAQSPTRMFLVYKWAQKGKFYDSNTGLYTIDSKPVQGFFVMVYDYSTKTVGASQLVTYWQQYYGMYYTVEDMTGLTVVEKQDPQNNGMRLYINKFTRTSNNSGSSLFCSSNAESFWMGGTYNPAYPRQTSNRVTGLGDGTNVWFPSKYSGYIVSKTLDSSGRERIGSAKVAMTFIGRIADDSGQGGANNSALYPNTYYGNSNIFNATFSDQANLVTEVEIVTKYLEKAGYRTNP